MKRFWRFVWVIWFYIVAGITGFITVVFTICCFPWRNAMQSLRRIWTACTFWITGIEVISVYDSEYLEYIHSGKPVIFCPNHTSHLDIPVMLEATDIDIAFIAKHELARNPLLLPYLKRLDILVKRNSVVHSALVWRKARALLEKGISLVIFPEGKIVYNEKTPCLGRLKDGAFKLSVETGSPIVPVVMMDNWHIMGDDGRYGGHPGKTRVLFLKPIYPEGDVRRLKSKYFKVMSYYLCNANIN